MSFDGVPAGWSATKLGDICGFSSGKLLPKKHWIADGRYPIVGASKLLGRTDEFTHTGETITIGRVGSCGVTNRVKGPVWVTDNALVATPGDDLDQGFLYYWLLTKDFGSIIGGSTQPLITQTAVKGFKIALPSLEEQRRITGVLGALDTKIRHCERLEQRLWETARCLFRDATRAGASEKTVDDIVTFHNRRRHPLSAREREQRRGSVPYYGATGVFDYVDEALFDEILILVGEDGSVVTPSGRPITQYIWGPAWVNNHAHVLTGDGMSTEMALMAIEQANVAGWVTGAVQPKLNMGNLKQVALVVPSGERQSELEPVLEALFALVRSKTQERATLAAVRDQLRPKLISGKLRVSEDYLPDAETPVAV